MPEHGSILPGSAGSYEAPGRAASYRDRPKSRMQREQQMLLTLLEGLPALPADARVLDAPCGAGRLLGALGELAPVIGLDGSPAMLREAAGLQSGAPLVLGDIFHLPLPASSVELAVCFRVLHHFPRPMQQRLCQELARVSRQYILLTAFSPWSTHNLDRRVRAWITRSRASRCATSPRLLQSWFRPLGWELAGKIHQGLLRDLYAVLFVRGPG